MDGWERRPKTSGRDANSSKEAESSDFLNAHSKCCIAERHQLENERHDTSSTTRHFAAGRRVIWAGERALFVLSSSAL